MSMSDPIADFLTRIRNANMAQHESVEAPASKMKKDIAEILKNEGFIRDVEYVDDNKDLIREAIDEGFMDRQKTAEWWLDDCYESIDVSLRCYVLSQAIDDAIEELED